jgi:hypothetical protein
MLLPVSLGAIRAGISPKAQPSLPSKTATRVFVRPAVGVHAIVGAARGGMYLPREELPVAQFE